MVVFAVLTSLSDPINHSNHDDLLVSLHHHTKLSLILLTRHFADVESGVDDEEQMPLHISTVVSNAAEAQTPKGDLMRELRQLKRELADLQRFGADIAHCVELPVFTSAEDACRYAVKDEVKRQELVGFVHSFRFFGI